MGEGEGSLRRRFVDPGLLGRTGQSLWMRDRRSTESLWRSHVVSARARAHGSEQAAKHPCKPLPGERGPTRKGEECAVASPSVFLLGNLSTTRCGIIMWSGGWMTGSTKLSPSPSPPPPPTADEDQDHDDQHQRDSEADQTDRWPSLV